MSIFRRLVAVVLALSLGACVWPNPPQPQPPQPAPPTPPPVPPPVPTPVDPKGLEPFLAVKEGDPEASLEKLPGTPTVTQAGSRTIRSWQTSVPRSTGGFVSWEVHTQGGVVVKTFPW